MTSINSELEELKLSHKAEVLALSGKIEIQEKEI
jgi:hypothetical protein